jgi:uncharacterized protein DUF397
MTTSRRGGHKQMQPTSAPETSVRPTTARAMPHTPCALSQVSLWVGRTGLEAQLLHVHVRNSAHEGVPALTFTQDEWRTFVQGVKNHEFDVR